MHAGHSLPTTTETTWLPSLAEEVDDAGVRRRVALRQRQQARGVDAHELRALDPLLEVLEALEAREQAARCLQRRLVLLALGVRQPEVVRAGHRVGRALVALQQQAAPGLVCEREHFFCQVVFFSSSFGHF